MVEKVPVAPSDCRPMRRSTTEMIFLQALLYVHPHGWIITQWYKLAQEPNLFRNIRTK